MLRSLLVLSQLLASVVLAETPVYILRREDDSLRVERLEIAEGESVTFHSGEDGFIDIILPPSVGGSGAILQHDPAASVTVRNEAGGLRVDALAGGRQYERAIMTAEELRTVDIRVSVRSGDGLASSVLIRGYESAEVDEIGPVLDIFAGLVPLGESDYSVFTSTYNPREIDPTFAGTAPIEFDGDHHYVRGRIAGGPEGRFIVDMGAATTVLTRDALPEGTEIVSQQRVQYSGGQRQVLPGALSGATGDTEPVGTCTLPEITIGGIRFEDADATVIGGFEAPDGGPILGVIGMNLLGRAESMRIDYPTDDQEPLLTLGPSAGAQDRAAEIPVSIVGNIPFCRARINGEDLCLAVDTGARITILTTVSAQALGLTPGQVESKVRGLTNDAVDLYALEIPRLTLGGIDLTDLNAHAGPLPVLQRFEAAQPVGLLGNDLLQRFKAVELDFRHQVLRLYE